MTPRYCLAPNTAAPWAANEGAMERSGGAATYGSKPALMPRPSGRGRVYDLIIIGSGSAGVAAAEAAAAAGAKRVAVVEVARRLGGECPNWGCIPTKTLLRSVEAAELAKSGDRLGFRAAGVRLNFAAAMKRMRRIVSQVAGGGRLEKLLKRSGAQLLRGEAKFVGPDAIEVCGRRYEADRFILATGAEYVSPPIDGLVQAGFLTHVEALQLKRPPRSLVVIGGGPVGVEFAQIFAAFGSRVTIVEYADQLLPREDAEIAAFAVAAYRRRGLKILVGTKVLKVERAGGKRVVTVAPADGLSTEASAKGEGKAVKLRAEAVLVVTGKQPAVRHLDLEQAGVEIDRRGWLTLNDYLQTTNPSIYAAGDAAGRMFFTAVAHREGAAAAQNALQGNHVKLSLAVLPRGTYGLPEIGSVGLTESEAAKGGYSVGIGRAPYRSLSKSLTHGETDGFIKLVVDKKSGLLLGGHVVGDCASEIVHEIALAMYCGIDYRDLANLIHAFPTFSEGVGLAAEAVG